MAKSWARLLGEAQLANWQPVASVQVLAERPKVSVPKRSRENAESYRQRVAGVAGEEEAVLLFDPQTSGGLLACIPAERLDDFRQAIGDWPLGVAAVGRVAPRGEHDVVVRRA